MAPPGAKKFVIGGEVPVSVRTWGLLGSDTLAQINVGSGEPEDRWHPNAYQTVAYKDKTNPFSTDTEDVDEAAPESG